MRDYSSSPRVGDPALAYALRGREEIEGWLELEDALVFCAIGAEQEAAGVTGDLLEIGAYKGCSAILLGYLRRRHDRLVICDPFRVPTADPGNDAENERYYEGLGQAEFLANFRRFHDRDPTVVRESSAALLDRDDLFGRFRFVHVDGSHRYDAVARDIRLSQRLLGDSGVVAFDDAVNRKALGVAAAVWEAVFTAGLRPLLSTGKIYATWSAGPVNAHALTERLDAMPHIVVEDEVEVAGHVVPFVRSVPPRRPRLQALREDAVPPLARKAADLLRAGAAATSNGRRRAAGREGRR